MCILVLVSFYRNIICLVSSSLKLKLGLVTLYLTLKKIKIIYICNKHVLF